MESLSPEVYSRMPMDLVYGYFCIGIIKNTHTKANCMGMKGLVARVDQHFFTIAAHGWHWLIG